MSSSHLIPPPKPATGALALDTYDLTKRFGSFTAMDHVTMRVEPGTVHALLGENGAGKSTLVKCVAGFQRAEEGSILIDGREQAIPNPIVARQLGIGMVYQHFTLAPGMTVAENLLLVGETPALIDWKTKRAELQAFLATTPFSLDLDARPAELAAGEKQKLELLKQFKARHPEVNTKSGLMVGLGETDDEILEVMRDMRAHNVDMLTIGQYLQPSGGHLPVLRYVHPDTFKMFETEALKMGFKNAACGPMVRSSYWADQQAHGAGVV